jgi:hypothetical protein
LSGFRSRRIRPQFSPLNKFLRSGDIRRCIFGLENSHKCRLVRRRRRSWSWSGARRRGRRCCRAATWRTGPSAWGRWGSWRPGSAPWAGPGTACRSPSGISRFSFYTSAVYSVIASKQIGFGGFNSSMGAHALKHKLPFRYAYSLCCRSALVSVRNRIRIQLFISMRIRIRTRIHEKPNQCGSRWIQISIRTFESPKSWIFI